MTVVRESGSLTREGPGKFLVQVITPGKGSSGTYPAETIEAAGRDKVFPAGTHMYLDHATESEEWTRPEGSLRNLVGVLEQDAQVDENGGLTAPARIYSHWRTILEEMKDDIGISIRASGEVQEANGERIITKLTEARSVDFVTKAGRGGKVLEILESAKVAEGLVDEKFRLLDRALRERHPNTWLNVMDHDNGKVWYRIEQDHYDAVYEQTFTQSGINVSFTGEPVEVVATTVYVPKTNPAPAGEESEKKEEAVMADTPNEKDTSRVDEADSPEVAALKKKVAELQAENAELKKGKAKEARKAHVSSIVEEAFEHVQAPTIKDWLINDLAESEDIADDKIIERAKAVAAEAGGTQGKVQGLGESRPASETSEKTHTAEDVVNVLEGGR